MRFEEQIDVAVPVAAAWEFLWQPQKVAACIPTCTGVKEIEPGKVYETEFDDHVGPYKVRFLTTITVEDAEPPKHIHLRAAGRDSRIGASQTVDLRVDLCGSDDQRSALKVVADVQILGKVATLGEFVIKRKVKDVFRTFAQNLGAAVGSTAPAGNA